MRSKVFQRVIDSVPAETALFIDWYADLVLRIHQILEERGLTQKEWAEQLGKSPSEISKWLNGGHNFTLRSLAKLSVELNEPLLKVAKHKDPPTYTRDRTIRTQLYVVHQQMPQRPTQYDYNWKASSTPNAMSHAG